MVLCKYFQQGNCRFGQYCKFEHVYGNRSKTFVSDDKSLALQVAEEVLHAEKGGQWLLSCYGPFKERKSIPGMEDVSPEEVRWEMYQAQKTGTVDQIKVQFQQMCEQMRAKREALKHPTPAIAQMLEEIQSSGTENTANKGNFAFGQPQLASSNQTSTVFGQKSSFGAQSNPFGSSTFNSTQPPSSIFGRPAANTSTNVFGGKSSFGSSPMFGSTPATGNSIFGGSTKPASTPFGGVQNAPTFGSLAPQGTSIFGASTATQSTFGQPPAFGANTAQASSPFLKPQTTQTSVFGSASTAAPQSSSVFGGATATPSAGSIFGSATAPAVSSTPGAGGIFGGQTASTGASAFGGAPVFGGSAGFGAAQPGTAGSVFGGQSAFGAAPAVSSSATTPGNVFGGANAGTSSFGALAQSATTSTFGNATTAAPNAFEAAPNASPFGVPISTSASPFGGMNTAANSVFASSAPVSTAATGPFGNTMTPFSTAPSTFGFATSAANTATNVFGTTMTATTQSPFGSNTFVSGTATANSPFAPQVQQQNVASPFGVIASVQQQQQQQASPFGNFGKSNISVTVAMIDETGYSPDELLTDDEKAAYRAAQFSEGHIPLRPPTKELC